MGRFDNPKQFSSLPSSALFREPTKNLKCNLYLPPPQPIPLLSSLGLVQDAFHFYRGGQQWRGKGDPSSRHFECLILNKHTSQPSMGSSSYQILNIASGPLLNSRMVFFTTDAYLNPPSLAIDFSPTLFIAQMMRSSRLHDW